MKNKLIILVYLLFKLSALQAQFLDVYLIEAANNNTGLKAKFALFEASLHNIKQVNSFNNPSVSFGYFISPAETRLGPQEFKLSINQMFPWFGSMLIKQNAASSVSKVKFQEFLATKNQLYQEVKIAYYNYYEAVKIVPIHIENLALLNTYKQLATKQFSIGKGSMADVLRIDLEINTVQIKIDLQKLKVSPLKQHFNLLLNKELNSSILIDTLEKPHLIKLSYDETTFKNNPRLIALDNQLKNVQYLEQDAIQQGKPKVGFGIDYVMVNKRNDVTNLVQNGRDILMPMATISLPIYRKKYSYAALGYIEKQNALKNSKIDAQSQILSNYLLTYYKLEESYRMHLFYTEQLKKLEQLLSLLYVSYSTSGVAFVEILKIQEQVIAIKIKQESNTKKFHASKAELDFFRAINIQQ